MALIIRSITNLRLSPISIPVPGYNALQPVSVAPSSTLDLLSTLSLDELQAIQPDLNSLLANSSVSVAAYLDTSVVVAVPSLTTVAKDAIASPSAGLVVFDSTLKKLCVYTGALGGAGTGWETVTSVLE